MPTAVPIPTPCALQWKGTASEQGSSSTRLQLPDLNVPNIIDSNVNKNAFQ